MHEKCVICTILHAWYFARCHLSMCVCVYPGYFSPNQALICRANWPEFHMPQGDIGESIKCPSDVTQRRNRVQILHFRFWLLLHFHLDFIVDIILQHAEGVIWPLCLWNPFKANCSLFSKKSVGVTWKMRIGFLFLQRCKNYPSWQVIQCSVESYFSKSKGDKNLPDGWGHCYKSKLACLSKFFRRCYLDICGAISCLLFHNVITC